MGHGWEAYNPNLIEPDPDKVVNKEPEGESETEDLV